MAIIAPAHDGPVGDAPPRDRRFFATAATVMAAIVIIAFSFQLAMGRSSFASPLRVHVHAMLFMGWVMLFVAQSWLAARGRLALHRRLGWIGAGWVIAMIAAGCWVATSIVQRGKVPFFLLPQQLLVGDPLMLLAFAGLTAWAISQRRRTDWHARLHVCAMAALMGPAFGRLIPMPLLQPWGFEISNLLGMAFPIAGMVRDVRRYGKVHPAWLYGCAAVVGAIFLFDLITYSALGDAIYSAVTTGHPGAAIPGLAYAPPPDTPLLTGR